MKNYRRVFFVSLLLTGALVYPCFGQKLDVSARTKTYGGVNGGGDPEDNVAVIWIQTPGNKFIKTLMVWSNNHFDFMLKNWRTISELSDSGYYDGVTSATRDDHKDTLKATWDCKDTNGTFVPEGSYEFWVEMTESDYWWQQGEEYKGKVTKGKILIDYKNEKTANGTAIENIFDVVATFDPTVGISFNAPFDRLKALSFSYNQFSRLVMIKLGSFSSHSGIIRIYDLSGSKLNTISFSHGMQHVYWDGKNVSGYPIPSGIYLFEIRINGDRATSSVYSAPLFK